MSRHFRNRESVGGYGAGKDCSVGCSAFDNSEGVGVRIGSLGYPLDGVVNAGIGGRERLRVQQCAVGDIDDGVDVVAFVGVNTYDKRVAMRNDIHDGHRMFSLVMDRGGREDRYQPG